MKIRPTEKEKKIFLDNMTLLKETRNPFTKISELLEHKYNPRQLCHHWRNSLDPELCLDPPLDDNDKQFIDKWILNNRIGEGEIKWQTLRHDLRKKTGRFRSENDVKNYWYSKQRRQGTPGVSDSDKVKRRQGTPRVSVKRRQGTPRVYDSDKVKKRLGTTGVSKMKGRRRATEVADKMRIHNILNH